MAFQVGVFQIDAFQQEVGSPVLVGTIPNIVHTYNTGTHSYALGAYFLGADSYAIAPAVETGWTFNTVTGELVIDTDAVATFGPFTVTATNGNGDTPSNAFTVEVVAAGGHYWPHKKVKGKNYNDEREQKKAEDKRELRDLIEKAALVDKAVDLLEQADSAADKDVKSTEIKTRRQRVFKRQIGDLRSELDKIKDEESATALLKAQQRVDELAAKAADELIVQIANALTDLIQEIVDDD